MLSCPVRMIGIAVLIAASAALLFTVYDSDSSDATVTYGECGKDGSNLLWSYDDESHALTITGSGEMRDYDGFENLPWKECTTVSLPDGMTSIGGRAFLRCSSLTSIVFPSSLTSIGEYAFFQCDSLSSVTVNGSVGIGKYAFYMCPSLSSVTVNGSVGTVGKYVFYMCPSLSSVTIHGSVESIEDYAFLGCPYLSLVTIHGSVGSIGYRAFSSCGESSSAIVFTVDGPVGSIGEYAFYICPSLTSVTIGGPVGSIGDNAFGSCHVLGAVTVTGPIASIAAHAFFNCGNLKTVTVACNDPLNIAKGSEENGFIAYCAEQVNHVHRYSAAYDWAEDGKTCTVHISCLNDSALISDEHPQVDSAVKIPPTEKEKGTTEYSVSGTYDGFAYSDTKDVKDIPATGKGDGILLYAAVGSVAAIALIGAAFFLLRRPKGE